jgi:hypothetical protein
MAASDGENGTGLVFLLGEDIVLAFAAGMPAGKLLLHAAAQLMMNGHPVAAFAGFLIGTAASHRGSITN